MAPEQKATKVSEMRSLVTKYTSNFPTRPHVPSSEPTPPLSSPGPVLDTVLLVGSRGGIGANLLAQLLQSAQVGRVYALNRARTDGKTDQKRQADEFDVQGLGNSLAYSEKLVLLEGDTAHPTLGLPDSVFAKVSSSVTTIIVNGWRVEFAPPLSVFEPLVAGVRNLIDICLRSPHRRVPHLLFCSSLAVTTGITRPTPLPETFISDPTSIVGEGYRESKWVVESIIETALQQTALNATVARIGQVCGSLNGLWKTHEWFPMIVKSSQHLGCLPMDDRILTWIPADIAAAAIIDLLGTTLPLAHIAHPNPISGALTQPTDGHHKATRLASLASSSSRTHTAMASPSSLTRRCLISRPSIASSSRIRLPVLSRTYHSIPPVPPLRTSYHPTRPVRPLPKWLGSRSASTSTALPDASATAASAALPPPSRPSRIRVTPPNLEAVKQEGYLDDDVQLVPADQAWLNITPDAISQLEKITAREPADVLAQGKLALRVGVESGGCHGYQYTMALTEERGVDDYVMQPEGVNCIPVVVDLISLGLLKGATLHHATELIGSSFRLQDNPQAKEGGACGCGVSWEAKT